MKVLITSDLVLKYYDPNKPLEIQCDAGKKVLEQSLMQDGQPTTLL